MYIDKANVILYNVTINVTHKNIHLVLILKVKFLKIKGLQNNFNNIYFFTDLTSIGTHATYFDKKKVPKNY